MSARVSTPDRTETDAHGRAVTHFTLKRCCNGCGTELGDVEDRDADDYGNLIDVRAECPNCAPVVELERAGCTTWQVTLRTFWSVDRDLDRMNVFAKGYTQYVGDKITLVGLRVGIRPNHVVAFFGDWLIRHPGGHFTVHAAPKAGGQG